MKRKEAFVTMFGDRDISQIARTASYWRHGSWDSGWGAWRIPQATVAEDVHVPYGAIIGDICGSIHSQKMDNPYAIDLINPNCVFTHNTVLTVAVAEAIGTGWWYGWAFYEWATKYPDRGYGERFLRWLDAETRKWQKKGGITSSESGNGWGSSWGSGAASRVSPLGWLFATETDLKQLRLNLYWLESEASASVAPTHQHSFSRMGAGIVASLIYLARCGYSKEDLRKYLCGKGAVSGNNTSNTPVAKHCLGALDKTLTGIGEDYRFNGSCIRAVAVAVAAFFESRNFVSAIQNAISMGEGSSTIACITGSIAEAFYKEIPQELIDFAKSKLPEEMIATLEGTDRKFSELYCTDEEFTNHRLGEKFT
jgi:ADP-ribosylglycohydrolase